MNFSEKRSADFGKHFDAMTIKRCRLILSYATLLASFISADFVSCKFPVSPPPIAEQPSGQVLGYVTECMTKCGYDFQNIDEIADDDQSLATAQLAWIDGRNQYEQARFAVEEFDPPGHYFVAAWFSDHPQSGFHYIEPLLWSSTPPWGIIHNMVYTLWNGYVPSIPNVCQGDGFSDGGIFRGMLYTLADIDSLKFSGLDSSYSRNSVNDVYSNFTGIKTVYEFYRDTVLKYSSGTDSLFNTRMDAAWNNMATTPSDFYTLAAYRKAWYGTTYLYPLDSAVVQVARVIAHADSLNRMPY